MKRIVIYRDEFEGRKRTRHILRCIRPAASFCGYNRNGMLNDRDVRSLARALEPGFTGYYIA